MPVPSMRPGCVALAAAITPILSHPAMSDQPAVVRGANRADCAGRWPVSGWSTNPDRRGASWPRLWSSLHSDIDEFDSGFVSG